MKIRTFADKNYKGIYFNGKTMRIALDPAKPILELDYPEFYDVKITDYCRGKCPYCYMDSKITSKHPENAFQSIVDFFSLMSKNEKPFQVAIGGGEPTEHPDFVKILRAFYNMGITPNYTTNGMFADQSSDHIYKILRATQDYCGGVAVSCHPHLKHYWGRAADMFHQSGIKLNFHHVISDRGSINKFRNIYTVWQDKVDHFVLLPYGSQGRAEEKEIDWEYLVKSCPEDTSKMAFGAGFHPYLVANPGVFDVSLYEPEALSKFLDIETMKVWPSSFTEGVA